MDKRPKEVGINIIHIFYIVINQKTYIKLLSPNLNKIAKVKISKKIFEQLDEFEKEDARQIQEIK